MLSINDFHLEIGGKPYRLSLNTHEVLTLQNTNPFCSKISGSEAISRQTGFSAQNSVLSPLPVKIAINVGRPSQLMTAFSPKNVSLNLAKAEEKNFKSPAPLVRKSLLSVLKGLDEVPPELAHPHPTLLVETDSQNIDKLKRPISGNLM